MDVTFSTGKLQKLCNSEKNLRGEYGQRMADLIMRRLADLDAAESLEIMRIIPGRCHELIGDMAGMLALDLVHPNRLIFEPNHDPIPTKEDGGLDWSRVTKITVIAIKDYH